MPPLPRQLAAYKVAAVGHYLDSELPFEHQLTRIQQMLRFATQPALHGWIRADDPLLRNHVFERRHSLAFYQRYRKEHRRSCPTAACSARPKHRRTIPGP